MMLFSSLVVIVGSQSVMKAPVFPNINPLLEVIQPPKGQPDRHYTTQSRKKVKKGVI